MGADVLLVMWTRFYSGTEVYILCALVSAAVQVACTSSHFVENTREGKGDLPAKKHRSYSDWVLARSQ